MAEQYTKTGPKERVGGAGRTWGEFFSLWSNRLSYIPFHGGYAAAVLGAIGTALETLGHLFKGRFGSAVTAAVTGAAATATNYLSGTFGNIWVVNALTGVASGKNLGTHARKGTEIVVESLSGLLGAKPQVLSSHMAGVGSIDTAYAQSLRGPGYWATRAANEKGRDPREMYSAYRSGAGRDHVEQLEAARAQQAALQQGLA